MPLPDRVFRARRVLLPEGERAASVHVRGERILAVRDWDDLPEGVPVVDGGDAALLPGLVDTHVHINDPGRADWEGFECATRAAAAGGVTTLVDMPLNSLPPTTSVAALEAKRRAAEGRLHVDVGFCGGLVPDSVSELGRLHEAGVLAFKGFLAPSGVDEFPCVGPAELRAGMREIAALGAVLLVHAESPGALGPEAGDPRDYATWLAARPPRAEEEAVDLTFTLARETGARAHVVHLSAASALGLLARARADDVPVSVETCPHYLSFAAERIGRGATAYKCAPPIRDERNRDALWEGLRAGLIDQVVTDHSPAPAALKHVEDGDFVAAWGGIASLQLGLAATWTEASARGFGLSDVVRWMCAAPARLVGLEGRKGALLPGADADLVLWEPDTPFVVDPAQLQHRHPITPYSGRTQRGRVRQTWVRGYRVYADGRFADPPVGLPLAPR